MERRGRRGTIDADGLLGDEVLPAYRPRHGIVDRIARGAAWTMTTRSAAMLGILATNALAYRLLGQNDAGLYVLATTIVTTAAIFAHFGLPRTVVRLVAEALALDEPGRARGAMRTVNWLNLAGGFAVFGLLAFGGGTLLAHRLFHSAPLASLMLPIAIWAAAEGVRFTWSEAFRGLHDIRLASLLGDPCRSVLMALGFAGLYVFRRHTDLRTAIAWSMAASAVTAFLAGAFLWPKVASLGGRARRVNSSIVIAIALPLTLTDLTSMVVNSGDNWVVGAFRSTRDVALYGGAGRLVTMLSLPLFVMNGVVAPLIAELWVQGKKKQLEMMLRGATALASIPSAIGLIVVGLAGSQIMHIVYGPSYARGGHILAILAVGVFFGVTAGSCNFALVMTGHHRIVAVVAALTIIVTIGGEIVGAHLGGMNGIAIASSFATAFQNVALTLWAKKRLGLWTHATLSPRKVRAFLKMRD
jgi:O-antigen/teichoic acid export membrane protein